jgi:SAM-dependent methyltransferase
MGEQLDHAGNGLVWFRASSWRWDTDMNSSIKTLKMLTKNVLPKGFRIFLRRVYYCGTRYHCNVCNNHLRTMFDSGYQFSILKDLDVVGGEAIPFDVCPICFSNSRTRLLCEYLLKEIKIENLSYQISLLHVAPEYGISARLRKNAIDYVAVDISPQEYNDIGGVTYCDITAIDFPDEHFDLIICSHVLEHVPDDRLAIKELFRVLRPKGTAILQVPISASLQRTVEDPFLKDPRECERRFGQHDHVRIYGADYATRLREGGFLVETFNPISRWGKAVLNELRLNPREKIFLGRK